MKVIIFFFLFLASLASYAQPKDLKFYIEQARQNSPAFRDLQNQILINQIDSSLLRLSNKTQINFLSNNSYAPVTKNGYGYDQAITNGTNIQAIVEARRNIFNRGNLANQYRAIALQSQSLLDTLRLSEQDLKQTIASQYITAFGDLLAIDFNSELYKILSEENIILKKLTQANVFKQTDYLSFLLTMQQQELNLLQSEQQYNTDYLTLNYLAGIVDTTIERLLEPSIEDSAQYDFMNSVFYKRFITDSLKLANQRALINYEYKPRIGAFSDAGYQSTLGLNGYKNFGYSVGVSIIVPIYDQGQKKLKYTKLDIAERTRLSNRDFYFNQYRQQVAQLNIQLRGIDGLVEKIKKQITYSKTLIEANNKLLQTGDIRMTDYVTAINTYLNAKNQLTQNYISRLKIISQLNYWR
jgi:outer membrane protein TolC